MNAYQPRLVLNPRHVLPALELDMGSIPPPAKLGQWRSLVEEITSDWVNNNQFEGKGTLWMWRSHSQRFHADGISVFISQSGLSARYLKYLQQQLTRHFGNKIIYSGTYWVQRQKGWQAFCHIENMKTWRPHDVVGVNWVEIAQHTNVAV